MKKMNRIRESLYVSEKFGKHYKNTNTIFNANSTKSIVFDTSTPDIWVTQFQK